MNILFVCSGNTCRSPMAENILRKKLSDACINGVNVSSAGLMAAEGEPISWEAVCALKKLGIPPKPHRSRILTKKLAEESDMIIAMTARHKEHLKCYKNVYTLSELAAVRDISDPFGFAQEVYDACARDLDAALNAVVRLVSDKINGSADPSEK